MRRELEEEVSIDTPYTSRCVGLINDDQTEVGRVHLGVVHLFDVERPAVQPRESEIIECGFRPVAGDPGRHGGFRDLVADLHEGACLASSPPLSRERVRVTGRANAPPPHLPRQPRHDPRRSARGRGDAAVLHARSYGNAGSTSHGFGAAAKDAVEDAREKIAAAIGARAKEIVFTSGATESNNLAIRGVAEKHAARGRHIVSVTTEHPAVLDPLATLARRGFEVTLLPVTPSPDPRAG